MKFLGLTRLDKRRIRSDLVETFKILNGFYNVNKGLFFDLDDGGRRGHEKKLFGTNFFYSRQLKLLQKYFDLIE